MDLFVDVFADRLEVCVFYVFGLFNGESLVLLEEFFGDV